MTDRYAVIGNPIAQSKSPVIHMAFARQFGQDIHYEAILAAPDAFERTVRAFIAAGGKGMNVTAPFKLEALALSDHLSERAQAAQAVNTLSFTQDGIQGDNTDGFGLVFDIQHCLGRLLAGQRVLVVGAGGAARGVLLPLLRARPASLLVVNRSADKAQALIEPWKHDQPIAAGGFAAALGGRFDVVINATSAGLSDSVLDLGQDLYAPGALAYEMVYGRETAFMADARAQGAAVVADGLGMLVGQAAESFRLWRGVMPDVTQTLNQLR
ncbi:shikimate dehydrogenase [Castellaniella sp.]|uniref:shikimate dehydrogenase n=1 Tax=Castellaniella sp. TaxID=1955812 RepID=UPI002B0029A5|nr:shikimate dehydrogenase [Castellaniella sp.]